NLNERDGIGNDEAGALQTNEGEKDADARRGGDPDFFRNRFGNRLANRRRGNQQKENTGPKNYSQRRRPRDAFAEDDRVGEEGVDAHAGRDGEWQLRIQTHQQSHRETDDDCGREHAAERHSGFAVGGKNLWIDDDDVGHREEGRDAGDGFGLEVGFFGDGF